MPTIRTFLVASTISNGAMKFGLSAMMEKSFAQALFNGGITTVPINRRWHERQKLEWVRVLRVLFFYAYTARTMFLSKCIAAPFSIASSYGGTNGQTTWSRPMRSLP